MKKSPYLSEEMESIFWPAYSAKLKNDRARATYWSDINNFVTFIEKDFLDITAADVENYYLYHTEKKSIKLATLQKKFRELSAFSDFVSNTIALHLGKDESFENYFFDKLEELNRNVKMAKGHIPTIREMDRLLTAAKHDTMYYSIFSLIYRCAIRPSEAICLKYSDFLEQPDGRYLKIGKGKSNRIIPLPTDIISILDVYNKKRSSHAEYYFYKSTLEQLTDHILERKIQDYAIKAGIPQVTMYGIRDASIALMCANGASENLVARDAGISERAVGRYKDLFPLYTLKESAIDLVQIRIEPPR